MSIKIDKDTHFLYVLREYPHVVKEVMKRYNLPCLECKGLAQESIENLALTNGLNPDDFLKAIEEEIERQKR